jgi:hypothetical protein
VLWRGSGDGMSLVVPKVKNGVFASRRMRCSGSAGDLASSVEPARAAQPAK